MMDTFTQMVLTIGRITPECILPLGTGFLVSNDGKIATTSHVVGNDERGLCVLFPHIGSLNAYQDTSDHTCRPLPATIAEIDPHRDLAILKIDATFSGALPPIAGFDEINVGDQLTILGFPHAPDGRRVLTLQFAELGAKVLLGSGSLKSKHGVINVQARPGQSGSAVLCGKRGVLVGVLVGAYVPDAAKKGISLGGINPRELHQTTHCISASYISDMLG